MNPSMTRTTQNSQVRYFIILMTWIYVMNLQNSICRFADKALMFVKRKSSLSIKTAAFSIVFIELTRTFKFVKNFLLTCVGTKFRGLTSTKLCIVDSSTYFTCFRNFCIRLFSKRKITSSRAKRNVTLCALRNVTRPFIKYLITKFTSNFDFIIPRVFVTSSRTINRAKFFKFSSTERAYFFHMLSLTLAMVNVNNKQEISNV